MLDFSAWPGSHDYYPRDVSKIVGITYHYTAGSPSATPEDIARYQISAAAMPQTGAGYPFPGIAYTLYVDGSGVMYLCHDLGTRCWHSGAVVAGVSRNANYIGICYAGDVQPNAAQLVGLKLAHRWCEAQLGHSLLIEGHRDAPYATSCPGPVWPAWRPKVL